MASSISPSIQGTAGQHLSAPETKPKSAPRRRRVVGPRAPWWFVVPALALYLFIVVWPSLRGGFFSFTDWDGLASSWSLTGLDNFVEVFQDNRARAALGNTVVLAFVVMIFQNLIGLGLALALHSVVKSRDLLRTIFFAPVILTPLVSGYIWSYLLAPNGAINSALRAAGLPDLARDWLGDPSTALMAVCVAIIWQFSGYSMVIFLAGLTAIPDELREAAAIDGAGPWRRFTSVILPLLNGAIVINLMLSLIGGLKQFDQVTAMTNGGPGTATETISTTIIKSAFSSGEYPLSTALAVVMAVVIALLAAIQYRITLRRVN